HDAKASALWRNVAAARRALGNDEGELQALNAAIDADRRDFMAWLRKAELHQRRDDNGEALVAWQGVLQLAAQAGDVPAELATTLQKGRDFVSSAASKIAQVVESEVASLRSNMNESEQRRSAAFVDLAVGRRRAYTNQCDGLFYPFLPADEFFDRQHFDWMPSLEAATDDIRTELQALMTDPGDALRPYVQMDKGLPDNKWSGLDHSLDWGACFLWEYGQPNQPVLDRCPKTTAALAALPLAGITGRSPNAFFSLLKPGTRIPPHTGVTNTRAIIHLPLIVPDACGFRVGGETREWRVGEAFAFDDTIEHEAWNESRELRAVLIFDVWNPHMTQREREFVIRYYGAADATGFNPAYAAS
ncbi:MAG TPA: aspartyl/asparaginyl beta-hydroxylase domain-containing protein, partial [Sphingorhabdus sp.]|nr:aspartyl/asparaginyl beta-hydroxylase domain-containing protein [Sphingorhabdus sp.]